MTVMWSTLFQVQESLLLWAELLVVNITLSSTTTKWFIILLLKELFPTPTIGTEGNITISTLIVSTHQYQLLLGWFPLLTPIVTELIFNIWTGWVTWFSLNCIFHFSTLIAETCQCMLY